MFVFCRRRNRFVLSVWVLFIKCSCRAKRWSRKLVGSWTHFQSFWWHFHSSYWEARTKFICCEPYRGKCEYVYFPSTISIHKIVRKEAKIKIYFESSGQWYFQRLQTLYGKLQIKHEIRVSHIIIPHLINQLNTQM